MTTKRRATTSLVAIVAGLVGMVAFLAGPAAADHHHDGLTSGGALASEGSVASGTAVAINGSTASGDAVAIDGSVASGCSTATHHSTASGGCDHVDVHKPHRPHHHHHDAPAAAAHKGALALTGASSGDLALWALWAVLGGVLLVALTNIFRRPAGVS